MNSVPEIRREKVFISPGITSREIQEKYGLHQRTIVGSEKERILRQKLLQKTDRH